MNRKESPQSVIDSYRRRQQMAPYFLLGLALLLVVVGIAILVIWFTGSNKGPVGAVSLFASPTPTVTSSATPTPKTPTATPPNTATVTISPTVTNTVTPSGPVEYKVEEGDTCWDIAAKNKVDVEVLLALNNFATGTCPIKPGDKILIPQAGAQLPTPTPLPAGFQGKYEYTVQSGDTLASIAAQFGTTVDVVMKDNKITDANKIKAGDKLIIIVKLTPTPAPTKPATATAASAAAATATATAKP